MGFEVKSREVDPTRGTVDAIFNQHVLQNNSEFGRLNMDAKMLS